MNIPGKRLVLGAAVAVAALGAGGVAYAVGGDDPAPEQGYVTYDQSAADDQGTAATPSPSTPEPSTSVPSAPAPSTPDQSTAPSTKPKQGDGRHRGDCPDKNGSQGRPTQPTQPQQTEPAQPQQTQPAQPEQNPADDA
jgi:hypothetical protein